MNARRTLNQVHGFLILVMSTVLLAIATGGPSRLAAQSLAGSLTGVVADPSGAVLVGTRVNLTDMDKGYMFTSMSDAQGRYLIRNLNPGNYRLTVNAQQFEEYSVSGIVIGVNENTSRNVVLKVGNNAEVVNVVSEAPLMQTEDATLGATINRQMINDLPLVGRDILSLTFLTPGVSVAQGGTLQASGMSQGNDLNFVSNGQRNATAALYVDGVVTSSGDPNPGVVRPLYWPSPDATQEFKVEQGIIRADTGFSGGTVINVVTRSGSNDIHGTAYDFEQNNSFNANSWANNHYNTHNQPGQEHTFGGVIGGPIKKDKSFFFLVYNGNRQSSSSSNTLWVPSDAERRGDFGEVCQAGFDGSGKCLKNQDGTYGATGFGQIWDPYSAQLANGYQVTAQNYIPYNNLATYVSAGPPDSAELSYVTLAPGAGNIIDPVAKVIMNSAFPEPNISGAAANAVNYFSVTRGTSAGNEFSLRVDQRLGDKDNLTGKFMYLWGSSDSAGCLNSVWDPCSNGPSTNYAYQGVLNYSHAVNPNTLLVLQGGVLRQNDISPGLASKYPDFDPATTLGMPSYVDQSGYPASPNITYSPVGVSGIGEKDWSVWNIGFETWQIGGSVDMMRGRHDIKVGADWNLHKINFYQPGIPAPAVSFNNTDTAQVSPSGVNTGGNALASMMVGAPINGATELIDTPINAQNPNYDFFAQDTWHITKNLTLDLGLRYEVQVPETESSNRICWFDPTAPSPLAGYQANPGYSWPGPVPSTLKGQVKFAGAMGGPRTPVNTSYNNIQPRLGFAYQIDHATVVRGGYGIFYLQSMGAAAGITSGNSSAWEAYAGGPAYTSNDYNNGNSVYNGATPETRLSNPFPWGLAQPDGYNQSPYAFTGEYIHSPLAIRTNSHIPYQQTWTLGIQRDLPMRSLLNVYYVGTKGTHLYDPAAGGLNYVPKSVESMTTAEIANLSSVGVQNPFYMSASGNGQCPNSTSNPFQNLDCYTWIPGYHFAVPYPQFSNGGSLTTNSTPFGSSTYHALQVTLDKRLTQGLHVQAAYTWSKTISDTDVAGGGSAYLSAGSNPGAVDPYRLGLEKSISGFDVPQTLSAIVTYDLPFGHGRRFGSTANPLVNAAMGGWTATGMLFFESGQPLSLYESNESPIPTFASIRPTIKGVLKKNSSFKKPGDQYFANAGSGVVSITPSFVVPSATVGNAPRFTSSVRSPGIDNANIGIFKSFDLESLRKGSRFELRIETFNAFNHPQFGGPHCQVDNSGTFGTVDVGTQNSPRTAQFGGKIYF